MQDLDATLEGMAGAAGLVGAAINAQGLAARFTQAACELMHSVLTNAMATIVTRVNCPLPGSRIARNSLSCRSHLPVWYCLIRY